MRYLQPDEPDGRAPEAGLPLLRLGFRPFYLCAALFAALGIPVWLLQYRGSALAPGLSGLLWHAHEMLYGFAVAVIVGFLFTAVPNWTGRATPRGAALAGCVLLWLAGRLALPFLPPVFGAVIDSAFLPVMAVVIASVLLKAQNKRNYFVPVLLLALAGCNIAFHLSWLGHAPWSPLEPLYAALYLITLLEVIIAGRVVPMFTRNAVPGLKQFRFEWLERVIVPATLAVFVLTLWRPQGALTAVLNLLLAGAHGLRWLGWKPFATLRNPLLWILHVGYLWLILALLATAACALDRLAFTGVIHLLAVGMLGGLIIGMITRTALGHTGNALRAGALETAAYGLVTLAAVIRVLPLIAPAAGSYPLWLTLAAAAWTAGFAVYLLKYTALLNRPRADGKPG